MGWYECILLWLMTEMVGDGDLYGGDGGGGGVACGASDGGSV